MGTKLKYSLTIEKDDKRGDETGKPYSVILSREVLVKMGLIEMTRVMTEPISEAHGTDLPYLLNSIFDDIRQLVKVGLVDYPKPSTPLLAEALYDITWNVSANEAKSNHQLWEDSRARLQELITWAEEFEMNHPEPFGQGNYVVDEDDYLISIDAFTEAKIREKEDLYKSSKSKSAKRKHR